MARYALEVLTYGDEPVTPDDLRAWARVDATEDDDLLAMLISSARQKAEAFTGRRLLTTQLRMSIDAPLFRDYDPSFYPILQTLVSLAIVVLPNGWLRLRLPDASPLVSVEKVSYRDPTNVSHDLVLNTDYGVDTRNEPGQVTLLKGWPNLDNLRPAALWVEYTCGFTDVAALRKAQPSILQGIVMHAAWLYQNRDVDAPLPRAIEDLYWKSRAI